MRYLIDLLLFSLHRRAVKKQYHNTPDSHPCVDESTFGHEHVKETEMQDVQLDDALRENDGMFLRVLATGNGVKKQFTTQEITAISTLAARYEANEFSPEQPQP